MSNKKGSSSASRAYSSRLFLASTYAASVIEEILRDFDAYSWGSHDVSREEVLARLQELTPEGWARVEGVMMKRLGESMARRRAAEREVESLSRLAEDLRRLIDRLDP